MPPFGYIGIDFGTSNSHFAYCNTLSDPPRPEPVAVGVQGSMTTCVLWRDPAPAEPPELEKYIIAYGAEALETWASYDDDQRKGKRFAFGFKPDLTRSEQACLDAWAFLLKGRRELEAAGLPRSLGPTGFTVVVGIPAEVGQEHRERTRAIAREAGLGEVECIEEPLGALAFHLYKGDIKPAEAREGVLVVDFGGGTLDLALVNAQGLREPWGDPMLGGRLFDDLFLQWVLDQNAGLKISEGELLVVWQKECRELKEKFSERWRKQGEISDFKGSVEVDSRKVWLRNASVAEFQERARRYRPSLIVRRFFQGLQGRPAGLVLDTPFDLFAWIERTLTGNRPVESFKGQFGKVILTGGSCWWPFMPDLVGKALGVDVKKDVWRSQNPEGTIGAGLALYNVLKLRNDEKRAQLQKDKPGSIAAFRVVVIARLDAFAAQSADKILNALMPDVEKALWDWYNNGGSLNSVEAKIDAICKKFETEKKADELLGSLWSALDVDLVRLLRDHLKQFMVEHDVPKSVARYIPEEATSLAGLKVGAGAVSDDIAREISELAAAMSTATTMIATLVIAAVKIKIILLAALAHPILAVILAAGALLAAIGFGNQIKTATEQMIKDYEFGSMSMWTLRRFLSENNMKEKIAKGRQTARSQLCSSIREGLRQPPPVQPGEASHEPKQGFESLVIAKFEAFLDLVINDLGVLEQIREKKA